MFNLINHLNYENPAATLPNGAPGVPFTDAQAGTFGYMLGPAEPDGRPGHGAPDPDLDPIYCSQRRSIPAGSAQAPTA